MMVLLDAVGGAWRAFRESHTLVIVVVFLVMMLDLIMMTTLEPILPQIIYDIHYDQGMPSPPAFADTGNTTEQLHPHQAQQETPTRPGTAGGAGSGGGSVGGGSTSNATLLDTTRYTGVVLSTKPGTEVIANIVVGYVVERFGHRYPMVLGCLGNMAAILGFAYGPTVSVLIGARIVQAISSSLSVVSGLSLLATVFKDEESRSRATGIAFGGLSVGIILGFPLGTTLYQYCGRAMPFFLLAGLNVFDGALRLAVKCPEEPREEKKRKQNQCLQVASDPYIIIALGASTVISVGLGIVIATESAWMLHTFKAAQWQLGVVLATGAVLQFAAQFYIGMVVHPNSRWIFCMVGMLLSSAAYLLYPFCKSVWWVIGPEVLARVGLGVFLSVISPLLGHIVDIRHNANYGLIYGMYAASYNLGLTVGPIVGGIFLHVITFTWLYWSASAMLFFFSFFCIYLYRITGIETKTSQLVSSTEEEKDPLLKPRQENGHIQC